MSLPKDDEGLSRGWARALRALPVATAGPGFNAAVRLRAAAAAERRRRLQRRGLGLATVLCLAALGFGLQRVEITRVRAARHAALMEEHRQLLDELTELRALAERRSLIRLGGDASTDLYLDLAAVPAGAAGEGPTIHRRSQG